MTTGQSGRTLLTTARARADILVVDGDPSVAGEVTAALPESTYRIVPARSIEEARRILATSGASLALVDLHLNADGGWDFIAELRRSDYTPRLPIIVLAGSNDSIVRQHSLRAGADRFLVKPISPETLRRVVSELLSARDDSFWALNLRAKQPGRLRELLFDPTTELPTIALVIEDLREIIEKGQTLNVFCIEIEPLFNLGERNFWESFDVLRREFVRGLQVIAPEIVGEDAVIATSHPGANEFYCFCRRTQAISPVSIAREIERRCRDLIRTLDADPFLIEEVAIFVGGSATHPEAVYAPRILYTTVRESKDLAERRETRYFEGLHERLIRAVRDSAITTHFQPVVDLRSGRIVGYEALSRGPIGSDIESPEVIFGLARDHQLVWDVELLCIQNVRPMLGELCERGLLFFNLESNFIQELHERGTSSMAPLLECGNQVVLEVTERSAIRDYRTFRNTLSDLKRMGFRIAIDDCGSGYATLEAVAELRPDYLKVGQSLFQKVEKDPIRRRLVDLVARCADSIGAVTVAEAIETPAQLEVCRELNIQLGQGYIFARPAPWDLVKNVIFK